MAEGIMLLRALISGAAAARLRVEEEVKSADSAGNNRIFELNGLSDGRSPAATRRNFRARRYALAILAAISGQCAVVVAHAQTLAPREDDAMARAREAYDSLPATDRRAIQENMVWAGVYKGGVDGEFGRMTFNAMRAFTSKRPGAAEGIMAAPDRVALAAEAAKARAAVDFRIVQEPRAGFSIGVPQRILVRRSDDATGAHFDAADKSAGLETFRMNESETSLQTLYESYRAPAPNRRISYSVIRPDFFVVTAETPTRASYTRVARGTVNGQALLRGFSISWPKAQQARYEILSVAIANSFDPFGQKAALARAQASGGISTGQQGSAIASVAQPPVQPAPVVPQLTSSAIAFAPNRFIAVLPDGSCNEARIGNRPARLMRHDPPSGLALFDVPGGTATRLRAGAEAPQANAQTVNLFSAPGEARGSLTISAGVGEIGTIAEGSKAIRVLAPLPPDATGGLVFSRNGHVFGLISALPRNAPRIPGAPPPAARAIIPAETVSAFLSASGLEFVPAQTGGAPVSAGKIAADTRGSIEGLLCTPPSPGR